MEECSFMRIVGEASAIEEVLLHMKQLQPLVVLINFNFPVVDRIAATRLIRTRYPHIVVIGLSTNATDYLVHAMVQAGGYGLLDMAKAVDDLCSYIRKALLEWSS